MHSRPALSLLLALFAGSCFEPQPVIRPSVQSAPAVAVRPDPRSFMISQQVTMSSDVASARIHYTLDGTEPTRESPVYAGTFFLNTTATVRARAFDHGGQSEQPVTATFEKWDAGVVASIVFARKPDPGVNFRYVEGSWDDLADVDWEASPRDGFCPVMDLSEQQTDESFAMRLHGFIAVRKTGVYSFYIQAGGRAQLSVGGEPVVDPRAVTGEVGLAAGWHPISLDYLSSSDDPVLQVDYQGPHFNRRPLTAEALSH